MRWLLNWIHLLLHARQTAIQLDNCIRQLGQMHHVDYRCPNKECDNCKKIRITDDRMTMSTQVRRDLVHNGYKVLPPRKWRKD